MKTIIVFLVAMLIPNIGFTTPLDFNGGVQNEHSYEEYIFITGEPIKLVGSYSESVRRRKDQEVTSYRFNLKGYSSGDEEVSLDRNMSYSTDLIPYEEIGQTTSNTSLSNFKESITVGSKTYDLVDFQFSKADVIDNRPASDFYEGNVIGTKTYEINGDEGKVVIQFTGENIGYENFWGSTETQKIDSNIKVSVNENGEKKSASRNRRNTRDDKELEGFSGRFTHFVSDSVTRTMKYSENAVNHSTIKGGYLTVVNKEVVSKYNYNIDGRKGKKELRKEMTPDIERLIVPKFRDVDGHWGADYIKKLYSLNVFDDNNSSIFAPDVPMTRIDFTKAVIRACDIRASSNGSRIEKKQTKLREEDAIFADMDPEEENYEYVKAGINKEIVKGRTRDNTTMEKLEESQSKSKKKKTKKKDKRDPLQEQVSNIFEPYGRITRAEAITIIMRTVGYETKAPNPGYRVSFHDHKDIPNWAEDSIYMAQEIGIVKGDENNFIRPNEEITRAQASALLVGYLEFLEKGLQEDYRENIMNFN